jgi:hypothetical protein
MNPTEALTAPVSFSNQNDDSLASLKFQTDHQNLITEHRVLEIEEKNQEKEASNNLSKSLISNKQHKKKHRHHNHSNFLLQILASQLHQKATSPQMTENVHYQLNGQAILRSVFRERSVDLYRDYTSLYDEEYQRALVLNRHGIREFSGYDATVAEVCASIFSMMNSSFARVFAYVSKLAGCSQLPMHACALLLKGTFFMIHGGFMMHKLHVNGENYQFLPNNIQFTRRLIFDQTFFSKTIFVENTSFFFVKDG